MPGSIAPGKEPKHGQETNAIAAQRARTGGESRNDFPTDALTDDGTPTIGTLRKQCQTIRKYAELPARLSRRLAANHTDANSMLFTLDELDDLLDHAEWSVYCAKGNERQKVLRILVELSKLLGSTIDPDVVSSQPPPKNSDTVYQIKMASTGIDPPICAGSNARTAR